MNQGVRFVVVTIKPHKGKREGAIIIPIRIHGTNTWSYVKCTSGIPDKVTEMTVDLEAVSAPVGM